MHWAAATQPGTEGLPHPTRSANTSPRLPSSTLQAAFSPTQLLWDLLSVPSTVIYAGLFLSAFASATLLPGSSEAALLALLVVGQGEPALLLAVATVGNVLGSFANWLLGRFFAHLHDRAWFPIGPEAYEGAISWFRRYGVWSLLLSWLPVVGDALTLVAGILRVRLLPFLLLVSISKAGRYLAILAGFTWWNG